MSIVFKNELDPIFETIGLLYFSNHPDWKEELIKNLNDYGIDGSHFYQKHFKIVEKYMKAFETHKVSLPQENFFFLQSDHTTLLLLLTAAVEHRRYLEDCTLLDPMALRSFLAYYITDVEEAANMPPVSEMPQLPDEKAMLEFLDTVDIKNEDKWYVLDLLRRPEYWFGQLSEMVRANLPAFEKAKASIAKPLEKLIFQTRDYQDPLFSKLADTYSDVSTVYLTLIQPLLQILLYSHGYQGLFNKYLDKEAASANTSREAVGRQLKALSDKSKLDILYQLKQSNMYNLELSEKLKLSPSTMSHHMNTLLACGFVTVEKQDGKVYYCLDRKNIEVLLEQLKKILL